MSQPVYVEIKNICKPLVSPANHNINLTVLEVKFMLCSENGAGKSTYEYDLAYTPDDGSIAIHGKPVKSTRPGKRLNWGLG